MAKASSSPDVSHEFMQIDKGGVIVAEEYKV